MPTHPLKQNSIREECLTVSANSVSVEALLLIAQQDDDKTQELVRTADRAREHLSVLNWAFRKLLADNTFIDLLQAEGLHLVPACLVARLSES